MIHYHTYRSYLKKRFGKPVVKIPLNGGFSCPNRDGTNSVTGCLFCDNRSFSPVADQTAEPPLQQLKAVAARSGTAGKLLLPYLQPFSNTYGTVDRLKAVYEPLLEVPGVIGLAVGTRPDCFSGEIFDYLADLARRTYLSIELGLQSSHDTTLSQCNRGHTWSDFRAAVERLAADGSEIVAHVMLGLPGETVGMLFETARRLAMLPVHGIKIHQLMIIAGTEFAEWYRTGRCTVLSLERYTELLCGFLEQLRPDQYIHRIVADSTEENGLIAPLWSADKPTALQYLQRYMDEHDVRQGKHYRGNLAAS